MAEEEGPVRVGGPEGSIVRHGAGRRAKRARTRGRQWSEEAEEVFLKALAAGLTVAQAAGEAGFCAATAYRQRRLRPGLAERWRALAAERPRPAGIVRYARGAAGERWGSRAKRVRCLTQWSEEVEEVFLDALAASCNVRLAAAEADVGHTSVYRQRRMRADFAEKWQAALEQGYARLEIALVEAANDSLACVELDAERPIAKMSAETALRVLLHHRAAVTGAGRRSGWSAPAKSVEHYRASILRKIAAITAARALDDAAGRR